MDNVLILDDNEKDICFQQGRCIIGLSKEEAILGCIYPYTNIQSYNGTIQDFCNEFKNRYWVDIVDGLAKIEKRH